VNKFVKDFKAGTLSRNFKSEKDDTTPEGEFVRKVIRNTFEKAVLGSDKEFLIMVYAPWCGHCKAIKPAYEAVAKSLQNNPNIVIAKMDGTLNEVS
jgi:thiol-disulfide isomerase/thioredoxin